MATWRHNEFFVERRSDREIVDALKEIQQELTLGTQQFNFTLAVNDVERQSPFPNLNKELQEILDFGTTTINVFTWQINENLALTLLRNLENAELYKDKLRIAPSRNPDLSTVMRLIAACRKYFKPLDQLSVPSLVAEDQRQHYEKRESALTRLEEMQDEFFRKMEQAALTQQAETQKRFTELEDSFGKRHGELDKQFAEKEKNLANERAKFDEEKKKFDERDTTVVRRELVKDVSKLITERAETFVLSKSAHHRRWWVFGGYVILILTFGTLAGVFISKDFYASFDGSPASIALIVRQLIPTVGCLLAVSYFIRWMNAWSQRHVEEEFYAKRYQLDINRAAFLVETVLEWAKGGESPPPYLVERLSRNLFESDSKDAEPSTAADALASAIFGSAASARIKVGENEIVLDRRGLRKIAKTPLTPDVDSHP